jgi:hypothetical protein
LLGVQVLCFSRWGPQQRCALHAFGVQEAVSTGRVVAVDLTHYQHYPHIQSRWQKNLDLGTVMLKTAAKVSVTHSPPCAQMDTISPCRCPNPLRFLVFRPETADESVLHEKSHVPLMKTVMRLLSGTANSQLTEVATSAKQLRKMSLPPI